MVWDFLTNKFGFCKTFSIFSIWPAYLTFRSSQFTSYLPKYADFFKINFYKFAGEFFVCNFMKHLLCVAKPVFSVKSIFQTFGTIWISSENIFWKSRKNRVWLDPKKLQILGILWILAKKIFFSRTESSRCRILANKQNGFHYFWWETCVKNDC